MTEIALDVVDNMRYLEVKEGESYETRFARENRKLLIRECDNDLLELPSFSPIELLMHTFVGTG